MKSMIAHTLLGGIKVALCWSAGILAGAMIGDAVTPISHSSTVSLELVGGLVVAGISSAMWLSSRMTKLADGQQKLSEGQGRLEKGQERLQDRFDNLPCHQWTRPPTCQQEKEQKP